MALTPIMVRRGYKFEVNMLGKAATWLLYLGVGCSMVTHRRRPGRSGSSGPGFALAVASRRAVRREGAAGGDLHEAVVMAGGEGTRLRPLTSNQPKPMVPIVGKPCMEHILELLREHGFEDVVVTVAFLPQAIRSYFGDGENLGLNIEYSVEESPLGTAGSVRLG